MKENGSIGENLRKIGERTRHEYFNNFRDFFPPNYHFVAMKMIPGITREYILSYVNISKCNRNVSWYIRKIFSEDDTIYAAISTFVVFIIILITRILMWTAI